MLADDVLPLMRTRAELFRWGAANAHGRQMHKAVDILEVAIATSDPTEIYAVTHKALASAIKVIARADDSGGIIGDACRRLLDLHPKAASAAKVAPAKLVDWGRARAACATRPWRQPGRSPGGCLGRRRRSGRVRPGRSWTGGW